MGFHLPHRQTCWIQTPLLAGGELTFTCGFVLYAGPDPGGRDATSWALTPVTPPMVLMHQAPGPQMAGNLLHSLKSGKGNERRPPEKLF